MSLSKVTGAPREYRVNEELSLTLYPLRSLHWGVIEEWIRSKIIGSAKDVIKDDNTLTQNSRDSIMKTAHQVAAQINLMTCFGIGKEDEPTKSILGSFEGMLRVIHQAVRTSPAQDSIPSYKLQELDVIVGSDIMMLSNIFLEVISISFPDTKSKGVLEKNLMSTK